ncbi:tRNA (adenine(37)-N6)-methyltransferase isoform X2 [Scleropages formosus]|uniref:tRNA (adenine(37)-N6)-methyltransferase isoform X2 n=1 Tax=Scleropages formosus TaxID=113540 RepID=UPI00087832C3|nr:tRNA (adenine(37)-N6)-methyltransferase isoform X2 [Scleropages formosus]
MSGCCSCAQHVKKLSEQISVMRKEIKNLRQKLEGALLSHKKHLSHLQAAFTASDRKGATPGARTTPKEHVAGGISLEQGLIETVPIGFISSCFSAKNGTPRQPVVCRSSRATLRIRKAAFNNPEHALLGLEHYSHIWIIFLFHKNGHLSYKAKVKPPRLNGQRVGLYSTRSPHRPNALGLTLAKLDKITDMISGTPVLDIKPYIPDYDCPQSRSGLGGEECLSACMSSGEMIHSVEEQAKEQGLCTHPDARGDVEDEEELQLNLHAEVIPSLLSTWVFDSRPSDAPDVAGGGQVASLLREVENYISQRDDFTLETVEGNPGVTDSADAKLPALQRPTCSTKVCYGEESYSTIASWIRKPPVNCLAVRFTQHAEMELREFQPPGRAVLGKPSFRFLHSSEEAAAAIKAVLAADPRSVYRRGRCQDKLFFFTLDTADITCWFGKNFAEVLRVQAVKPEL